MYKTKGGIRLEPHFPKVVKYEIRDYDVELFGGVKSKHIFFLEINPIGEAMNTCILIRLLGAGLFDAGMLKRVNSSYPRIIVEFSTDTAQESKATPHIENPQLVISPKRKRSEGICEHSLHYCTIFFEATGVE